MFRPVSPRISFPELEEEILKFWQKEGVFKKSLKKNKDKKRFVFYEGPPTANGKPGVHHVLARSFKDIICRYKTMQGFLVERKGGWDTHGLPVELEVEKQLGISGKQDILNLKHDPAKSDEDNQRDSIKYFNQLCKENVFKYVKDWKEITDRIGFWIDMEDPYVTLDNRYIETVWWSLKKIWEAGLLVADYKVAPYCPRCGTPLSSHEVALGYKDNVPDPSVYVKFELVDEPGTFFLVWTTTPWTLPGNVALAVGENIKYVKVNVGKEKFILAKFCVKEVIKDSFEIEKELTAEELVGKQYKPLYQFIPLDKKAHYVAEADFATEEEGTGIVHTAVMYGEEDFDLGKKLNLPMKHLVNNKGEFVSEAGAFAGKFVKKADKDIIVDLEKRGLLYKSETIKHTYPFCWRCETPLLYYALDSWFIKTTAVKDKLIKNNQKINWVPGHVKNGRMGEWLESLKDWNLSRNRFWGTPLPIWKCPKGHLRVIGSAQELGLDIKDKDLDLHRPFIDAVTIQCEECAETMSRLSPVIDVWFDSGSMPYAQWHYPFENNQTFKEWYPADYICEAMDQTRGWFYTLLATATLLEKAGEVKEGYPYENVISLGLVLDEKGQKMSKSRGNVVDPWEAIGTAGADAMRWYFFSSTTAGNEYRFSIRLVEDVIKRFFLTLWNSYVFFVTYANIDGWSLGKEVVTSKNILDQWVLSELDNLIEKVTADFSNYNVTGASRRIEDFVVNKISTWYLRRSRNRVGPTNLDSEDKDYFYQTTYEVLITVAKLLAPFAPFISEKIYRGLTSSLSVHLEDWPKPQKRYKAEYEELMEKSRLITTLGHAKRKEAGIKVRQPLKKISIPSGYEVPKEYLNLVLSELNIKEAEFTKTEEMSLDTKVTKELKAEGAARELIREVQEARKKAGVTFSDEVLVYLPSWPREFGELIKRETLAKKLLRGDTIKIQK
ncbi:MAG: isoleucine--tRNA ligase [bacterium]|nr:isoleucine--tRNA ligase [bacterium]